MKIWANQVGEQFDTRIDGFGKQNKTDGKHQKTPFCHVDLQQKTKQNNTYTCEQMYVHIVFVLHHIFYTSKGIAKTLCLPFDRKSFSQIVV